MTYDEESILYPCFVIKLMFQDQYLLSNSNVILIKSVSFLTKFDKFWSVLYTVIISKKALSFFFFLLLIIPSHIILFKLWSFHIESWVNLLVSQICVQIGLVLPQHFLVILRYLPLILIKRFANYLVGFLGCSLDLIFTKRVIIFQL